jgi:hypothetical protein
MTTVGKRLGPNPDYDPNILQRSDPRNARWLYQCATPGCDEPRDLSGPLPWDRAHWPKHCAAHRDDGGTR